MSGEGKTCDLEPNVYPLLENHFGSEEGIETFLTCYKVRLSSFSTRFLFKSNNETKL